MKVTALYTYPIKSLRSTPLTGPVPLTPLGFPYDRVFLLLKVHPSPSNDSAANNGHAVPKPRSKAHLNPNGLENMTITYFNELCLFLQTVDPVAGTFTVAYTPPVDKEGQTQPRNKSSTTLELPLEPQTTGLEELEVHMHGSPTKAYRMLDKINKWFTQCLGYEVILAYLGPHCRKVLGSLAAPPPYVSHTNGTATTPDQEGWLGSLKKMAFIGGGNGAEEDVGADGEGLTFADLAAYLVVTEESLKDVSTRLPEGVEMDVSKFRANVVVSGAERAWEEDFWGGIVIFPTSSENGTGTEERGGKEAATELVLTHNCGRCVSINVDYKTGRPAGGEEGKVLKKLMGDRRVDQGSKWSPIFGRYGFLRRGKVGKMVRVGDEVVVSRWNEERTVFDWPGM